jgi:hypothetical protein
MKFTKRSWAINKEVKLLVLCLLTWRILLFIPFFVSPTFLALQGTYLGGNINLYRSSPLLWAWANFDGQHYLSIAKFGYRPLTYFFFPVYPLFIRWIAILLGQSDIGRLITGILISHLALIFTCIGLYKLIRIDFTKKIAYLTILLLLIFPASFYFVSVYTESLFLALVVWSFYLARKGNWAGAVTLAAVASASRVVGIVLLPALFIEMLIQYKNKTVSLRHCFLLLIIPIGIISYMLYLKQSAGDHLAFFHSVEIFGAQRSTHLVLIPQVFYRYVFKVLPVVSHSYSPVVFTTWLEFISAITFLITSIATIFKLRISYAIYALGTFIIPPLSGSFSSLPRYAIVIFPAFVILAIGIQKLPKTFRYFIFIVLTISLLYTESLFIRGYWVS